MAGVGSLVDLLLFYTLERHLFNRMVHQMGRNPTLVKLAMALWLMLEEIGYSDLIRKINAFDDWTIEAMFIEALHCVPCIQPNAIEPSGSDDTPIFVSLFDEPMNRRFFYYHRTFMYKRFTHIMESVCNKIFGENGAIEVDETSMRPVVRPFHESTSAQCASTTRFTTPTTTTTSGVTGDQALYQSREVRRQSNLNPNASEFVPEHANDDTRTMFLTFSKGFPLTREEIFYFFTSNWGDVVEDVVVEQAAGGEAPLYGSIIFTTSSIIPVILNGQSRAKFMVSRKHLWARIYVPRRR